MPKIKKLYLKVKYKKITGFTLIELLVVISIIGFLASMAVFALNTARLKSRTAKRVADLKQISTALEMYYDTNNGYPNSGGNWDGIYSCWGDSTTNWIAGLAPTYIGQLPRDPRNHTNCGEQYIYTSNGINYKLISHGPEDCATVKSKYPSLIDPARDCWAFGYWTPGAVNW